MKFNFKNRAPLAVKNHEGAKAYQLTPEMALYSAAVTSTLSDSFYEKSGKRIEVLRELIAKADPAFVAKLAVYAREKMHLRSVPLVLAVELARIHKGDQLVSQTVNGVVQRADEITELLAYYQAANGRTGTKKLNKLSKQVQKGLASAFQKFDEYQFAKYNRDAEVKLRDALFLVHPKAANEDKQTLFAKIASDSLAVPYTWEVELSRVGQQKWEDEALRKLAFTLKWEEMIKSGLLGYMALLRNLRNILEAQVSAQHIEMVCKQLADEQQVLKSKQLPFRFLSAYREMKELKSSHVPLVLDALEAAVRVSAKNIPGYSANTRVAIACDVSGSMQKPVSAKSTVQLFDIGLMLGMLLQHRCANVITGMFGDRWKAIQMPRGNVLANVMEFHRREGEVGYSTNGHLVIQDLIDRKVVMDKVMMFTDCQLWNTSAPGDQPIERLWKQYRKMAPKAKLYLFDLAGYGTTPLQVNHAEGVSFIAGWSEKVFGVLDAIDKGENALAEINSIDLK
jgi:hypothetical protein